MNIKKLFHRFNIIDFFVCVFLVVAIVVSAYYYTNEDGLFKKQQLEIEYTISLDKVENEFIGNLSYDDTLYDFSSAFEIGRVSDIRTYPLNQGYCSMDVVVRAIAEVHGGTFSVNGVDVFTGKWMEFRTPNIVHAGNCTAVMILEKLDGAK